MYAVHQQPLSTFHSSSQPILSCRYLFQTPFYQLGQWNFLYTFFTQIWPTPCQSVTGNKSQYAIMKHHLRMYCPHIPPSISCFKINYDNYFWRNGEHCEHPPIAPKCESSLCYLSMSITKQYEMCEIWGSHNSVSENSGLLGCDTVSLDEEYGIHSPSDMVSYHQHKTWWLCPYSRNQEKSNLLDSHTMRWQSTLSLQWCRMLWPHLLLLPPLAVSVPYDSPQECL